MDDAILMLCMGSVPVKISNRLEQENFLFVLRLRTAKSFHSGKKTMQKARQGETKKLIIPIS